MSPAPALLSPRSTRFYMALLLMLAFFCTTSMRSDLGMAMVCMVNDTAVQLEAAGLSPSRLSATARSLPEQCSRPNHTGHSDSPGYSGSFTWSSHQQSLLFSATFWGAVLTILPSGLLVDRHGPKWALLFAVSIYTLFTLLSPMLATRGFYWLFLARFIMGFGEGFAIPSISAMIVRWFPVAERSTVTALYTSGNQLAGMLTTLASAELCASHILGGWPAIFYLLGSLGALWCIVWLLFASNSPAKHSLISSIEQAHLERQLSEAPSAVSKREFRKLAMPWRAMLCSGPVYSNIVGMFVMDFGDTIVVCYLPSFFKEVLNLDVQTNGLFTALPFVTQLLAKNVMAVLADGLKRRGLVSNTTSCKAFQGIASLGSAASFTALGLMVDCRRPMLALGLIIAFSIVNAAIVPGTMTSMISIAPAYTGTLLSVYQAFGTMAGVISPILVGYLNEQAPLSSGSASSSSRGSSTWSGGVIFLLLGSGEVQPWARPRTIYEDLTPKLIIGDTEADMKSDKLLIDSIH